MSYLAMYSNSLNNADFETAEEIEIQDQEMRFRYQRLNTSHAEIILARLPTVTAIDFAHNQINLIPNSLCYSLLALDLSYNLIELPVISIHNYRNLIELNLSNNKISDLSGLTTSGLITLEYLNISSNLINLVSGLEHITTLKVLKLQNNKINTFSSLRLLSYNRLLTDIYLEGNVISSDRYLKNKLLSCIPSLKNISGVPIRKRISLQSKVVNDGLCYAELCNWPTTMNQSQTQTHSANANNKVATGTNTYHQNHPTTDVTTAPYNSDKYSITNSYQDIEEEEEEEDKSMMDEGEDHTLLLDPLQYATKLIINASTTLSTKKDIVNKKLSKRDTQVTSYHPTSANLQQLPWRRPPSIEPKYLKNITSKSSKDDKIITNNKQVSVTKATTTSASMSLSDRNSNNKIQVTESVVPAVTNEQNNSDDTARLKTEKIKYEVPGPWMAPVLNHSMVIPSATSSEHQVLLPLPLAHSTSPRQVRARSVSPGITRTSSFRIKTPTSSNRYSSSNLSPHHSRQHSYNDPLSISGRSVIENTAAAASNRQRLFGSRSRSPFVSPTRSSIIRQEYVNNTVSQKLAASSSELELTSNRTYYSHNRHRGKAVRSVSPLSSPMTKTTFKRQEYISNKLNAKKNLENKELELINNRTYRDHSDRSNSRRSSRSPNAKYRIHQESMEPMSLNTSESLLKTSESQLKISNTEGKESPYKKFLKLRERISDKYAPTNTTLPQPISSSSLPSPTIPKQPNQPVATTENGTGYSESKRSSHTYDFAHKINPDDVDNIFQETATKQKYFDELQKIESKVDSFQLQERLLLNISEDQTAASQQQDVQSGYSLLYSVIQQRKSILESIAPPPPPPSFSYNGLQTQSQQIISQPQPKPTRTTQSQSSQQSIPQNQVESSFELSSIVTKPLQSISDSDKTTHNNSISSVTSKIKSPPVKINVLKKESKSSVINKPITISSPPAKKLYHAEADSSSVGMSPKFKNHQEKSLEATLYTDSGGKNNTDSLLKSTIVLSAKDATAHPNVPTETATAKAPKNIATVATLPSSTDIAINVATISTPLPMERTNSFLKRFAENNPYMKQLALGGDAMLEETPPQNKRPVIYY